MRRHRMRGVADDEASPLGPWPPWEDLENGVELDYLCLAHHRPQHVHPFGLVILSQEVEKGGL